MLPASRDVELYPLDDLVAAILDPGELEFARPRHLHEEGQKRVGGDAGLQVGLEHLITGKARRKEIDDVARDDLAVRVLALTRFHDMGDQGLDLDQVARFGSVGQLDAWLVHCRSSLALAAAATDGDFYGAPTDQKFTVAQFRQRDHLLR